MSSKEQKFLTTQEVLDRYRIRSKSTLWLWRKDHGFPGPIQRRLYSIEALDEWDKKQAARAA